MAGNNVGADESAGFMRDDKPQVGYQREWGHQLNTYYHAKNCYCHVAVEVIFILMIIGFDMRELYLYRRIQKFEGRRITRKSVSQMFRDDLLTEKVKQILYQKGGYNQKIA